MRQEGFLISKAQSRELIEAVNVWCRRTGTNYNKLVVAAGVNVSTRSSVLHRHRRLTKRTASRLWATMAKFPSGISKDEHKARVRQIAEQHLERQRTERRHVDALVRVDRTPCPVCGARGDSGCGHSARFERRMQV